MTGLGNSASYTKIIDAFAKELDGELPDIQMRCDIKHANGHWYRISMRHLTTEETADAERQLRGVRA